jgi:hypothetical protein
MKRTASTAGSGAGGKLPPDPRMVFVANPSNGRSGSKRSILSTEIVEYEPVARARDWPELIEFALRPDRAWLFGPSTKFLVRGKFVRDVYVAAVPPVLQVGEVGAEGYVAPVLGQPERWETRDTVPEDRADLLLAPNWFELLIKQLTLYHKNVALKTTNEPDAAKAIVNAIEYAFMDDESKVTLGQTPSHPIFGLDTVRGSYGSNINKDKFIEYSRAVFGPTFTFPWIPMHGFPFWQSTNFPKDEYASNIVPMHYSKYGLDIQMLLHKNQDIIYKPKRADLQDRLRFVMEDFRFVVEEANLPQHIDRFFCTKGKVLRYQGLSKNVTAENVQAGVMTHKVKFSDVYFPEGFIVFSAPKKVVAGTYSYNDLTIPGNSLLTDHNIREVKVSFGGKELYHKSPHYGELTNPLINFKHMLDYLYAPPFGLKVEPNLFSPERIAAGCADTDFPHVYINLRNTKDGERVAPVHEDGSITALKKDLEIQLFFNPAGAAENSTYYVYTWYSDTYMEMHLLADRDIAFVNNYMQKM